MIAEKTNTAQQLIEKISSSAGKVDFMNDSALTRALFYLEEKGIPTMIYYPIPLHFQTAYKLDGFGPGSFPVTEQLSKTVISLPIHTEMTNDELMYICSTIKEYSRHA